MTLIHYLINGHNLPLDERDLLFKKIYGFSFMRRPDPTHFGFLDVFWESEKDIRSSMNILVSCIIKEINGYKNFILIRFFMVIFDYGPNFFRQ